MSISASTLFIFALLIPGVLFRVAVFYRSIIKRPFSSSNSIYISIVIIFFSLGIHIIAYLLFRIAIRSVNRIFDTDYQFRVIYDNATMFILNNSLRFEAIQYFIRHQLYALIYFAWVIAVSLIAAEIVWRLSFRIRPIGRLLYGSLAPLIHRNSDFVTCFVLTKITHERKRVAYAGFTNELSLKEGNNIDHIVIEGPAKFYLKLNEKWPKSTIENAREISLDPETIGLMYISGTEIENVHFEGWDFTTYPPPAASTPPKSG